MYRLFLIYFAECLGCFLAENRASAKHHVSVIENSGLSGCDSSLRFLEGDSDKVFSELFYGSWLLRLTVACLDLALNGFIQMIPGDQVDIVDIAVITHKVVLASEDNLIGIQGLAAHIEGFRCCNSEPTALTNGVMNLPLVSAEDFSLLIYEITRFGSLSGILFNKGRIIPVWHKADILAVRFIGIDKALLLCNLTDFLLGVGAKRKATWIKIINQSQV